MLLREVRYADSAVIDVAHGAGRVYVICLLSVEHLRLYALRGYGPGGGRNGGAVYNIYIPFQMREPF